MNDLRILRFSIQFRDEDGKFTDRVHPWTQILSIFDDIVRRYSWSLVVSMLSSYCLYQAAQAAADDLQATQAMWLRRSESLREANK